MRLHVLSLPHTQTTSEFLSCAYTQKVVKFSKMMTRRGHEVILYSGEQNEAECAEHVVLMSEEERAGWFGSGFDTVLTPLVWEASQPYWQLFNGRAIEALRERVDMRNDVLCLITGWPQKPVTDALGIDTGKRPMIACEWAVGYEGIYTEFCAFESSAWMHHIYGLRGWRNGRFYDAVIPNFFDPADFYTLAKADYLLYMGRLVGRKGVVVAAEIAKRAGMKLIVAGPGATAWSKGSITAPEFTIEGDVEYVGEVGLEERAELMAQAKVLLCPTLYVEPFGGVCVEAMMSGTPVLTTDFGAFRETVTPDVGRRFATLAEADAALEVLMNGFTPDWTPRPRAPARYSLEAVAPQFERWFEQLLDLWDGGFYA
jgi:glycosyltransferase involved in cell wall biosynthesis